jgi:NAD-dependent deacetylase
MPEQLVDRATVLLSGCERPVVFTGAGVSKESGIPTFRDALEGLWAQYDPQELATPEAFQKNPELVWNFYQHRRDTLKGCHPNPAHYALAALERSKPNCTIITQNVDGFHQRAGSQKVIPLHGNISENRCFFNCPGIISSSALPVDGPVPPICPDCGEKSLRPNVIWFGEFLDDSLMAAAMASVKQCDLLLIIGTSGVVQPAASLALQAIEQGKVVIEINPEPTMYSTRATVFLPARAAEILPRLILGQV